jgi:xylulose-5-phosphate/fructose-6-phosphate phosphoketolase
MTGGTGIFPSYEAFLPIVHTMMVQYSKFMKVAKETPWRQDLNSLNYIETSTWTRQEHNGLSHQNPCFIGAVLNLKATIGRVYLPPDANTFLSTLDHCLHSKNYINLIVGSKAPLPVWLTPTEAAAHCKAGSSIWNFASTNDGIDPDVVLVGIGAEMMFEVIAAAAYLRKLAPKIVVRVVNVTDLMILGCDGSHPHSLTNKAFDDIFTANRRVHFNYHGYKNELQGLLFGRGDTERFSINSYDEEGSTTTPFDMVIRNHCSRFHVAEVAVRAVMKENPHLGLDVESLATQIQEDLVNVQEFIMESAEGRSDFENLIVFAVS